MKNLFVFQEFKYDVKRLCKLVNYGGGEMIFCKWFFFSYYVCFFRIGNIICYVIYCCLFVLFFFKFICNLIYLFF